MKFVLSLGFIVFFAIAVAAGVCVLDISARNDVVDDATVDTLNAVYAQLGRPNAELAATRSFRRLEPCRDPRRAGRTALWYQSPLPLVYPVTWVFVADAEGDIVCRSKFVSP